MNNKKAKKTVKGMTLMECIISLLVVGVAGTVMVIAGTTSKHFLLNASHMNNKTEAESAVGANRNVTELTNIAIANSDVVVADSLQIEIGSSGHYGTVDAHRYHSLPASKASPKDVDTGLEDDASLEFYVFD